MSRDRWLKQLRIAGADPRSVEEVLAALDQSGGSESFIELTDGTLWPAQLFEVDQGPADFDPASDRWLLVVGLGSGAAYGAMQRFVSTIEQPDLASRLSDALAGSGAFRLFQTELSRHEDEYTRWHRFRDDARLARSAVTCASATTCGCRARSAIRATSSSAANARPTPRSSTRSKTASGANTAIAPVSRSSRIASRFATMRRARHRAGTPPDAARGWRRNAFAILGGEFVEEVTRSSIKIHDQMYPTWRMHLGVASIGRNPAVGCSVEDPLMGPVGAPRASRLAPDRVVSLSRSDARAGRT